jgi:hypothetical protein
MPIVATVRDNNLRNPLAPDYWFYFSRADLPMLGGDRARVRLAIGEESWTGVLSLTQSHPPYLLTSLSGSRGETTCTEVVQYLGLGHEARLEFESLGVGAMRLLQVLDHGTPAALRARTEGASEDPSRYSELLTPGEVYTRQELAERFSITDATLNTGIFQPRRSISIWLFVTESKPRDRVQYVDRLVGDALYWQGQTSGRKDSQIIDHRKRGTELLVFYRREKYDHPRAGFRYEGVFSYESHSGQKPASFTLRREAVQDEASETVEEALNRVTLGHRQRYQADSVLRRMIERHAVEAATAYFEQDGWSVLDVGATQPFDLLCLRDDKELRVEVKGTSQAGESILLTRGEVKHATSYDAGVLALFILHGVRVIQAEGQPTVVEGGEPYIELPWVLSIEQLEPLQYEYRLR